MQEIIIISLVVAVVLAVLFWRRGSSKEESDYQEPAYHPSGKEWVFNGILDIENPPSDNSCLINYGERIQLMTRKGYMLYEMHIDQHHITNDDIGVYYVQVSMGKRQTVVVSHNGKVIGELTNAPSWLSQKINEKKALKAYAFIASRKTENGEEYYGDVCVEKE